MPLKSGLFNLHSLSTQISKSCSSYAIPVEVMAIVSMAGNTICIIKSVKSMASQLMFVIIHPVHPNGIRSSISFFVISARIGQACHYELMRRSSIISTPPRQVRD